jgi:hypothetical protein
MTEQLKRLPFFQQELIQAQQIGGDSTQPTLNDIEMSDIIYIEPRLYFGSKKRSTVYIFEEKVIVGSFKPYSESIVYMQSSTTQRDGYLTTFGIDNDNQLRVSYVKFWDHNAINASKDGNPSKHIIV